MMPTSSRVAFEKKKDFAHTNYMPLEEYLYLAMYWVKRLGFPW